MTEKFIEKNLDYEGWQAYKNGSEEFKKAIRIGLKIQMAQVDRLLKKMDEKYFKKVIKTP